MNFERKTSLTPQEENIMNPIEKFEKKGIQLYKKDHKFKINIKKSSYLLMLKGNFHVR